MTAGHFPPSQPKHGASRRHFLVASVSTAAAPVFHETTEIDPQRARYVNDNLADYSVPVNARHQGA